MNSKQLLYEVSKEQQQVYILKTKQEAQHTQFLQLELSYLNRTPSTYTSPREKKFSN